VPNGVRRYVVAERDGVIFVWPGGSPPSDPPAQLGAAANPRYKTRRFGGQVECHFSFMHENLMDMNHQFLHRKTSGTVTPRYLGKRAGEGWLELDYSFRRPDQKPPIGETLIVGRLRGESASPRDLMTIRTEYPHQTLRLWTSGELPVLHVWLGYTPVGAAQRKNRTFIVLSVRRPRLPGVLEIAWPFLTRFTNRVFAEDREVVEMEQKAYDAQGGDWNQEVFPAINELRGLLARSGIPSQS
jgi:phenylpropionate dioxygenase-like ring-hydroxylating dioxygenase large terminal subunit